MPVVWGRKTESEKFAGALRTYSIEALMGDGRALQAGTSHNLGQHFATAYGIEFLDKDQQRALPWSTSWGTSTRMIGGLIMTHGDDAGLILPPRGGALPGGDRPHPAAQGRRQRDGPAQGARGRGPPARRRRARPRGRPRHPAARLQVRRLGDARRAPAPRARAPRTSRRTSACWSAATPARRRSCPRPASRPRCRAGSTRSSATSWSARAASWPRTRRRPRTGTSFKQVMADKRGFIVAGWCGDAACEAKIKEETRATIRVIPIDGEARAGACVRCGGASAARRVLRAGVLRRPSRRIRADGGPDELRRRLDRRLGRSGARLRPRLLPHRVPRRVASPPPMRPRQPARGWSATRSRRGASATRGRWPRCARCRGTSSSPRAVAGRGLRRSPPSHRARPDDLAAVHRRLHDRGPRACAAARPCSRSGRDRATRPRCWPRSRPASTRSRSCEPLAERARADLARLGYENVHVRAGDGYQGWPEAAPFDAIIVTAAAPRIPEPLKAQLKDGRPAGDPGRRGRPEPRGDHPHGGPIRRAKGSARSLCADDGEGPRMRRFFERHNRLRRAAAARRMLSGDRRPRWKP